MGTHRITQGSRVLFHLATSIAVVVGLLVASIGTYAQDAVNMAPPLDNFSYGQTDASLSYSADTVFNWTEIPQDQAVPIQRAVFDQGGYQLFDTVGETIVVPFTDNNLYVMKFAVSDNGTMYFVNDSSGAPVLYIPQNGYLENAAVPGARWYPFSEDSYSTTPVYMGIAPSWSDFVGMGWYPEMVCSGGYWCSYSYLDGGIFVPTTSIIFLIGGYHCNGWRDFDNFCYRNPAPCHTGFYNHNVYRWADRPHSGQIFIGSRSQDFGRNRGTSSNYVGKPLPTIINVQSGSNRAFAGGGANSNSQVHITFNNPNVSEQQNRVLDSGPAIYGGPARQFRGGWGTGATTNTDSTTNSGRVFQGISAVPIERFSGGRSYDGGGWAVPRQQTAGSADRSTSTNGGSYGNRSFAMPSYDRGTSTGSSGGRSSGSQSSAGRDTGTSGGHSYGMGGWGGGRSDGH